MRYRLRGENDYINPIDTILNNRNITIDLFNLDSSVVEDYNNYTNMELAVSTLMNHISKNNNIAIIPDVDVDGFTSSAMLFRYIRDDIGYEKIEYIMHKEKIHGLSKDIVIPDDTNLILIPDASSNDYDQHMYYKNKGIDIIVLDHHPASHLSKNAIVVNNRLSENIKNEEFSGAGVTYKFMKALDEYLFQDNADYYLDLVALGNVADMVSFTQSETRYLCLKGIKQINNLFLKALIEKNSFQLQSKYNIMKIGWVISPQLNGTVRNGTEEVRENMFKAFISNDYEFCLMVAEQCKKAKSSQDGAVKRILPKIEQSISLGVDDKVIMLEVPQKTKKEHIGLIANKIQSKYGLPVFLYKVGKNGGLYGSTRGNPNITQNFKSDIEQSKLFDFAEGQPQAFGLGVKKEDADNLKEYLNKLYKDKEIINEKLHEVDFIIDSNDIDYKIIEEVAKYEDEWGNGISEPLILFRNIPVNITDEEIKGTRSKTLVFEFDQIKFVKSFLSNDIKDSVLYQGDLSLNIIGKCVLNYYNGDCYPQVEIIDMEINKVREV